MKNKYRKLFYSLGIDVLGMTTYLIPGLGEGFDLAWAPISAMLIYKVHGNAVGAAFGAIEELAPMTDFIPTATLVWLFEVVKQR